MIDLAKRLSDLSMRLMATTEFYPDAHTVAEAGIVLMRVHEDATREKTIQELQAEVGRLTMELQHRVCGDPCGGITLTIPQPGSLKETP